MGWAKWAKSSGPRVQGIPSSRHKKIEISQQICIFWAGSCTKMRLAVGLHPDPLSGAIALPQTHIRRRGGKELRAGKERVGKGGGRRVKGRA